MATLAVEAAAPNQDARAPRGVPAAASVAEFIGPHEPATVALLDACSDAAKIARACNARVRRSDRTLYLDFVGLPPVPADAPTQPGVPR